MHEAMMLHLEFHGNIDLELHVDYTRSLNSSPPPVGVLRQKPLFSVWRDLLFGSFFKVKVVNTVVLDCTAQLDYVVTEWPKRLAKVAFMHCIREHSWKL